MIKPYSEYSIDELNAVMDKKWARILAKNPGYNRRFLNAMHDLLDWYEEKAAKIKQPSNPSEDD